MSKTRLVGLIGFILFAGLVVFLAFNKHSRSGRFNYHSEIFGDKAGYYVYLPGTFQYDLDPRKLPKDINNKVGNGFSYDKDSTHIISKYTCGVALLQLPFYFIAQSIPYLSGNPSDGFSVLNHKMINVACVFYFLASLIILFRTFSKNYSTGIIVGALALLFFGTNLHYYTIFETGMSHVYSFFLFSCTIGLFYKTEFLKRVKPYQIILMGIFVGWIILIRPINLLFLVSFFFLSVNSKTEFIERFKRIVKPKYFLVVILCIILIWLPQILYWKYTFGSYLHYSYGEEGFNWLSPQVHLTLFSPKNGLITNNPIYVFLLLGLFFVSKSDRFQSYLTFTLYVVLTYVLSCWWNWEFGCAFGARSYVEYLALLFVPLLKSLEWLSAKKTVFKSIIWVFIIGCCFVNLKLIYTYDNCFHSYLNWNWDMWLSLLTGPIK